jgi:CheY-like chemotaxis protein
MNNTKKFKLLVAEDETICQMALKNFAKKLDIDIDIAGNGAIAVDKAKASDYDLVLMDMYMPELDGRQATEKIRKLGNGSKFTIIALSASNYIYNDS